MSASLPETTPSRAPTPWRLDDRAHVLTVCGGRGASHDVPLALLNDVPNACGEYRRIASKRGASPAILCELRQIIVANLAASRSAFAAYEFLDLTRDAGWQHMGRLAAIGREVLR